MSEYVKKSSVISYIDRLQNCGLGKKKALDFLKKFIEKSDATKLSEEEIETEITDSESV